MTSWLNWALSAIRVAFGVPDPEAELLTPAHGWLLPATPVKVAVLAARR
jgi:hypothetical protein